MDNLTIVALITGGVSLSNGIILALFNRKWKRRDACDDEVSQMKNEISAMGEDIKNLSNLMSRLGNGLNIGLRNDKVIFRAFRDNSINGDSEAQERVMDEYFTQCALSGFNTGRKE